MAHVDFNADTADVRRPTIIIVITKMLAKLIVLLLLAIISIPFWPFYWLGSLISSWPVNVPRLGQITRYFRLTWTIDPPYPGLSLLLRVWMTLLIIQRILLIPMMGCAWLLDELIYGRQLEASPVVAPLIEISAGRSGSTQIAHYLEDDPQLAAPSSLQCVLPYLWLWHLAPRTIGRFMTPEQVRQRAESAAPPEQLERHEADPFKTDTFEVIFYLTHLNMLSFLLGPQAIIEDFGTGRFAPHNQQLWEEDFIEYLDRIGRKTVLYAGVKADGLPRRFFVKGHFLCVANVLEEKYPDAHFLTIIRDPVPRLRSTINFLRVLPPDPILGPCPWEWLSSAFEETEAVYCEVEEGWLRGISSDRHCVIQFSEYVQDLEKTMQKIYRSCFDVSELPAHVPTVHTPRERRKYSVNRSLAELGIDEAAFSARLASYIAWCHERAEEKSSNVPRSSQ